MELEFVAPVLFSGHHSLCHAPFLPPPPNTPSGQLTPSMLQSKFMILLLQHHPGSSTSISSPSLQPSFHYPSLSFSILSSGSFSTTFLPLTRSPFSRTHTNDKSGTVFCTTMAYAFSFTIRLHWVQIIPQNCSSEFCALTISPLRASIK